MRTLFYIVSIVTLTGFGYWSYTVNYATRAAEARVADLDLKIWEEQEKIEVLRAEWAYLNRPERLMRLAEANFETLGLVPVRSDHYEDPKKVAYKNDEPTYSMMLNVTTAAARTGE